jgi:hypothetical protein
MLPEQAGVPDYFKDCGNRSGRIVAADVLLDPIKVVAGGACPF